MYEVTKEIENAIYKAVISHTLFVTFTDAAAMEIRSRMTSIAKNEGHDIEAEDFPVMTFNAFSNNIIKAFYNDLGFTEAPGVVDVNPTARAVKAVALITGDNAIKGLNYGIPLAKDGGALNLTLKVWDLAKEAELDPNEPGFDKKVLDLAIKDGVAKKMIDDAGAISQMCDHYQEYLSILKSENLISFADQDTLALQILDMHPEYLDTLGIQHMVVDEAQDSNDKNMEFINRILAVMRKNDPNMEHHSLTIVGDDNQSIYGFRKANPQNMIDFDNKIGMTSTKLFMTQNFRSKQEILDPANALVALNVNRIDKPCVAARGNGGKYTLQGYDSVDEELDAIVDRVAEMINSGITPRDIAVLSFKKATLQKLAAKLSKKGVTWVIKAPLKLIENSRVHGAIEFMQAFKDPTMSKPYFEYLIPLTDGHLLDNEEGLSEEEMQEKIQSLIGEVRSEVMSIINGDPNQGRLKLHEMLEAINVGDDELYTKWLDMMYQHGSEAEKAFQLDPANNNHPLIEEIAWIDYFTEFVADTELKMDQDYEGVVLSTAHSSKGLEWPYVINTISDYDNARLHRAQNVLDVEETRRLLFVSMTRAREELLVTGAYVAYKKDDEVYNQFLKELYVIRDGNTDRWDAELLARAQKIEERAEARKKASAERAKAKREADKKSRLADILAADGKTVAIDGKRGSGKGIYSKSKYATKLRDVRSEYDKKVSKIREMTETEKTEYNSMTANATQMSLADIIG